jgi:uncharacterized protein (TIGR00369 family)
MAVLTAGELEVFLEGAFPQRPRTVTVEAVTERGLRVRQPFDPDQIRPGGTISGPTLMALADTAMYLAVVAAIGPVALAVTTSLHIDFLRKPAPVAVIAEVELLKLGSRLAVGEVRLFSEGSDEPVARASATYSIPPVSAR